MNMNKLGLVCVVVALFLSGCGKKDKHADTASKTVKTKKLAGADVPTLQQETEKLFDDDGAVSEFAFVDDENGKNAQSLASAEDESKNSDITTEPVLAMAGDEDEGDSEEGDAQDLTGDDEEDKTEAGYAFNAVNFDFNKNDIRPDQIAKIDENCEVAREAFENQKEIVVQGHSDQIGSASYNLALSQQRAEAVKAAMVEKGLDESHIKTVGYGFEMPLVYSDKEDRASLIKELEPNRRAEVLAN